ncbi:MAG: MMPL family transporter [Phycisphaerales bacterium]
MSDRAERLGRLAAWSAHHPRWVLGVCLVIAASCVAWTVGGMEFRSDRSALVDPSLDWQQRYRDFKETFPHWDDAIIVVEGDERTALDYFLKIDDAMQRSGRYPDRTLWYDPGNASDAALLLESDDAIRAVVDDLARSAPLLAPGMTLEAALRGARANGNTDALLPLVLRALDGADSVLQTGAPERALFRVGDTLSVGFVPMGASEGAASVNDVASRMGDLRALLDEAAQGTATRFGVTGIPVIESDETAQSTRDAALASTASFVLIALLLAFVYRGVFVPLCALGALLVGVAWSFGWLMISVGHLQVLSVVFAIVLLGLGVDGAIHLIARLELVHPDHDHMPGAVGRAAAGVGPGIVTGALTTAAAFGATALSPFTGVAEMGVIAAGGVVLCTIAILLALPALFALLPHPERNIRTRTGGEARPFAGRLGLWIDRHPAKVFGASAVVMLIAALCAGGVLTEPIRYDPDLIALMPPDAEGVAWERRLREADERSSWHAVVVARDPDDAQRLTRALDALPEVESVGGAGVLFPGPDVLAKRAALLRTLPDVAFTPTEPPVTSARVDTFRALLADLGVDTDSYTDDDLARTLRAFERDRAALAARIASLRTVEPVVRADDLPPAVRERFVAPSGEHLLRVYPAPAGGLGPLHPDRLGPFVEAVLRIAPGATGPSVQVHESTKVILDGYRFAALLAAGAILVLLLVDFRSLPDTLCAVLPVAVGLVLLLGVMAASGIALNFANTIVMPLIIGLGVDAGVHAVHRWRTQPSDAPAGLAGGTGRAITLTSLTTAIGFACMVIAEHRGVRSLGIVMTLGLLLTWVASVFVLPPVLRLRTRRQR